MEIALRGIGVSPGIAIGPVRLSNAAALDVSRRAINDPVAELARYDEAADKARETLTALKEQTAEELGDRHAAIFQTHIEMLDDPALRPEIESRVTSEKFNIEFILNDIITSYTKLMEAVDDPLFRERSMDFVDVGRRLLGNLLEEDLESLDNLEEPCIIMAEELSPSEVTNLDMTNTLALATDAGGPTSHMAIIARAFEIPSVVGLRYAGSRINSGDTIIVDGAKGLVVLDPSDETLERYRSEKKQRDDMRRILAEASKEGPSVTLDGTEITTWANIELYPETELSKRARCQGIGLYRTEFLFINRTTLPTEQEQYEEYRRIIEAMAPLPVRVRTLDIGGDKTFPAVMGEAEANPQLGWRSIRLCLDRPDVFKAQLRALYRASAHGRMEIMFPLITGIDQLLEAKQIVEEVKADLEARGVAFDRSVKIGSMVEVPAAVMVADRLAADCDFLSIGSNDLIQYCLAVDRTNRRTAHLYQPAHLSMVRMLRDTIKAANKAETPCSICGEMAGDPVMTELLLGLGFDTLSMSSVSLPAVRAEIANIHLARAKRFARKVLSMSSAQEIRALLQKRYEDRGTVEQLRKPGD